MGQYCSHLEQAFYPQLTVSRNLLTDSPVYSLLNTVKLEMKANHPIWQKYMLLNSVGSPSKLMEPNNE